MRLPCDSFMKRLKIVDDLQFKLPIDNPSSRDVLMAGDPISPFEGT